MACPLAARELPHVPTALGLQVNESESVKRALHAQRHLHEADVRLVLPIRGDAKRRFSASPGAQLAAERVCTLLIWSRFKHSRIGCLGEGRRSVQRSPPEPPLPLPLPPPPPPLPTPPPPPRPPPPSPLHLKARAARVCAQSCLRTSMLVESHD